MVRLVQSKQAISKDTLAGIKKNLKSPSKSHVCKTLTTLDSIAANCSTTVRSQLAEMRWIEMLLSVCYKNPTAALPICQLLSNWLCSYSHEQLGHAANFAAQALSQKGYSIPPPVPLAHHMVWLQTDASLTYRQSQMLLMLHCRQRLRNRAQSWLDFSVGLTSQAWIFGCLLQIAQVSIYCLCLCTPLASLVHVSYA